MKQGVGEEGVSTDARANKFVPIRENPENIIKSGKVLKKKLYYLDVISNIRSFVFCSMYVYKKNKLLIENIELQGK